MDGVVVNLYSGIQEIWERIWRGVDLGRKGGYFWKEMEIKDQVVSELDDKD